MLDFVTHVKENYGRWIRTSVQYLLHTEILLKSHSFFPLARYMKVHVIVCAHRADGQTSDDVGLIDECLWPRFELNARLRRYRQSSACLFRTDSACRYQRQWRRSVSIVIKSVKVGSADAHFNAHKAQVPAAAAQQHPLRLRLERCTVPTTASQPVSRNSPHPSRVPWLVPVCWLMLVILTLRPSPLSSVCPVAQERSIYWSQ